MAAAAAAGMDSLVVRYYRTKSDTERAILSDIIDKALEIAGEIREDQANRIIFALSQALDGKGKGRSRKTRPRNRTRP